MMTCLSFVRVKSIKISSLSLLLFSVINIVFCGPLNAADSVELIALGFYEGSRGATQPDWDSPQIKTTFDKSTARNIFTLIQIKNNLWKKQKQVVKMDVRYLRSNGAQIGEKTIETQVPADRESIELWAGWGWEIDNQWDPGFYKVELWLNTGTKLGEGHFHIKASTRTVSKSDQVEFDKMGFYEADGGGSDQAPGDWNDSRLRNNFASSEVRYIYTMMSLKNLQWNIKDHDVSIHIRYYFSDGKLFGAPVIDYAVPIDWEYAELWNGWGWTDAGNWKADRYRVELWLDNKKKIGESYFTIH